MFIYKYISTHIYVYVINIVQNIILVICVLHQLHFISLAIFCASAWHLSPSNCLLCFLTNALTKNMSYGSVHFYAWHCNSSLQVVAMTLGQSLARSSVSTLTTRLWRVLTTKQYVRIKHAICWNFSFLLIYISPLQILFSQ